MFNSYHMVFINLTAIFLLSIFFVFYCFIYPKKKISYFWIVVLISLLPLVSLLRYGDYESGDFNIHIYRSMTFFNSLKDGQFIPSWAGELNSTFGYPLFIFLNPLPYYLVSFFHFIGFSFIASMKFFLGACYVSSGIFMYIWCQKTLKNNHAAFTAAVLYLFAPYHLLDLHFRATVGETLFFAILPFEFFLIHRISIKKNLASIVFSGIGYSLLFFSHLAMAIFSSVVLLIYITCQIAKDKLSISKKILYIFSPFLLGIVFSCYIWIPHVFLSKYTLAYILSSQVVSFPKLNELLFSSWQYGFLFQGPKGELSYVIGYIHLLIITCAFILLMLKRKIKKKNEIILWLLLSALFIFLSTSYSYLIWKTIHFINAAQFSTRLLLLVNFCTSVVGGYFALNIKRKNIVFFLLFLATTSTILNWGQRRVIPQINDEALLRNLPFSTSQGEGLAYMGNSKWWPDTKKLWISKLPSNHLESEDKSFHVIDVKRSTVEHEYVISLKRSSMLKDNTVYFPGWELYIDNKKSSIVTEKLQGNPFVYFQAPKGIHTVSIVYKDVNTLFVSKVISMLSLFTAFVFLLFKKIRKEI